MVSVLWVVLVAAGAGVVAWLYRRREASVGGRGVLAGLRLAVLAILALLLVDPSLPGGLSAPTPAAWIVVDGSLSMEAAGAAPRAEARRRAGALADSLGGGRGAQVLLFGDGTEAVPVDSLVDVRSEGGGTFLAPALERAAESGAAEIHVLSDLRVADPVAVEAALAGIPARVRLERVGPPIRNAAVAALELPGGVTSGERPTSTVRIRGEGEGEGDSVTVEVREEGRLVEGRRAALPERGREVSLTFRLPAPRGRGEVRYAARVLLDSDDFSLDDERVALVTVDPPEGGALFLSLRPDWEPRFLLPVLRQVTGLELTGYLRVGEDRWISLASAATTETGRSLDGAGVRRLLSRSEFLVLHGAGGEAPGWLREAAGSASRVLVLPDGPSGAALVGVSAGTPLPGEWEPVADLPPSPLAAELAGLELGGLPPLGRVLPLVDEESGTVPLRLALRGRGPGQAALVLGGDGERRWAVTLASGFWRWAFRDGAPREAYRRLWAAVASWLLSDDRVASGPGVRPASRVTGARRPVTWTAPGLAGRSVHLEVRTAGGEAEAGGPVGEAAGAGAGGAGMTDTTLSISPSGSVRTAPLPPGSYRYRAVIPGEGDEVVGEGRLEVEAFSDELLLPVLDTAHLGPLATGSGEGVGATAPRRALRTHPLPWVLVLVLLSAEWIGRRRRGLR